MRRYITVIPALGILILAILRFVSVPDDARQRPSVPDIHHNAESREVKAVLIEAFGPDATSIVVGVDKHVAVLSGNVQQRSTQRLADRVAESVDGIIVVHNFLDLVDGAWTSVDVAAQDTSLKKRLTRELSPDVFVDACDGVVLLQGVLPNDVRHDAAIRLAESLTGVSRVIDFIHIAWTSSIPVDPTMSGGELWKPMEGEK